MPSVNDMTTTYADEPYAPSRALRMLRQLGIDTQYALLGFPLGILTVSLCVPFFFLGIGLSVIWIGLVILPATLIMSRGFATVERARIRPVLHRAMPHPYYKKRTGEGFLRRVLTPVTDGQAWLDLLHGAFRFIPSTIAFAVTVAWWAGALGGLSWSLWGWSTLQEGNEGLPELLGFNSDYTTDVVVYLIVGTFFALTLYPVVRGVALLEALFARGLLSGVNELRTQVAEANAAREVAQAQKAAAVSAEATALRRLERDIHDGPQQRLVRLAMDLGRARQQLDRDPAAARATLDEALGQTRETLDELRALSRGIAPPILTDRGLAAALNALVARGLIPISLTVAPELGRLPAVTESTAYFVVAEALANVAKHSRAENCAVAVGRVNGRLQVAVVDDGEGGAHVAKGHGLAGLADRVRAAGGTLSMSSPVGGPTEIRAELPCG
jgi:signal transduction histidine kinase